MGAALDGFSGKVFFIYIDMATKLILIRHGATAWNLQKRYCGFADLGLSQIGRQQVRKLSQGLSRAKIHKVYSSDRKRAMQTARIIFGKREIEIIPELREIHFGAFEGLTHKQILKKHNSVYQKWLKDPYRTAIPKGEALKDFKERIISALKKIIRKNPNKTIAVVCHGGTISVFINSILKAKNFWQYIPKSASVSVVECDNGKLSIKKYG